MVAVVEIGLVSASPRAAVEWRCCCFAAPVVAAETFAKQSTPIAAVVDPSLAAAAVAVVVGVAVIYAAVAVDKRKALPSYWSPMLVLGTRQRKRPTSMMPTNVDGDGAKAVAMPRYSRRPHPHCSSFAVKGEHAAGLQFGEG